MNDKKDLLYVLGTGSTHDNIELRYSLRSIEKYCTNYGRIFVIGADPGFLSDKVIYIPHEDFKCGYKHHSILTKIQIAAFTTDISDNFVLQSDDHFYVKPYDFATIPVYHKGYLKEEYEKHDMHKASLRMTKHILENYGYPIYDCSHHCGTLLNKDIITKINRTLIYDAYQTFECAEPSSLISNVMLKEFNMTPQYRKDIKIFDFDSRADFDSIIKDNFCFSIYDEAFDCGIEGILQELYPNKSKYEI